MSRFSSTSSFMVIARVGRLFKLEDSGWHGEAIDWIGEAMEAIGYHTGFLTGGVDADVCNHRVEFPCNIIRLSHVMYNGCKLIVGSDVTSGMFVRDTTDLATHEPLTDWEYTELTKLYSLLETKQAEYDTTPTDELALDIEDLQSQINVLANKKKLPNGNIEYVTLPYYNLNGRFINTSFAEGTIRVYGRLYPVDENGYPMIVDSYKYREACFWYITKMLLLQGHSVSKAINFESAEDRWDTFRGKAAAEGIDTGRDKMDQIVNMMHSIKRGVQLPESFRLNGEQRQGTEI